MLNWKSKPALEEIRAVLAGWNLEVPARAQRFHDLRTDLEKQVEANLGRWFGGDDPDTLSRQVERLSRLVAPLTSLIRRSEELEKEVLDLRSSVERSPDRELAQRLVTRCVGWQSKLRRLGANAGRESELELDQATLNSVEDEVRDHAQALRLLEEARNLLARLGNKMETATLQADFPQLRQRLLDDGASAAWTADMGRALAPAKAVVDLPPKTPPKTLQQVSALLHTIRRWTRALATGEERASVLQDQHKIAEAEWEDWTEDQIRVHFMAASAMLDELRQTAVRRSAEILALLGARRDQLAGACGPDPELDRTLGELKNADFGEPETYGVWMEEQAELHRRIRDAAGSRLIDLQERIVRKRRELLEALAMLEKEPLFNRVRSEAGGLRLELEDLPDPREQGVEPIFDSLGACDRIARELDGMAEQARNGRRDVQKLCEDLLARNSALQEEARRSGIEAPDLAVRIETLATIAPGASLDDLLSQAESLGHEIRAVERELVARCAVWIEGRLSLLRGRAALLRQAGVRVEDLPVSFPENQTPARATDAVVATREAAQGIERQLEELKTALESRSVELLGRLRDLPLKSLRPEVRRDAGDLTRWFEERAWEAATGLDERVRLLLGESTRCDVFLAKLSQEERDARDRTAALRRRLRELNDADLDRFCPEALVRRVSALIAAIPAEPASWAELAGQIATAEGLIGLLETHARRVLAARLDRAIPDLERQASISRDPEYAQRLRALLDEVAARDDREPVPAGLAAQILMLTSQPSWEGTA